MELIENGQVMDPIIINDTNLIIDGNKRYYAFKRLGYKNVTVIKQQLNRNDLNGNEFSILNDIN
jgi:ParB-like chromosome segregation protein Spo0J